MGGLLVTGAGLEGILGAPPLPLFSLLLSGHKVNISPPVPSSHCDISKVAGPSDHRLKLPKV